MVSSSLSSSFQISTFTNFSISPKPSIPHHKFLIRMPTTRPIDCSWSSSSPSHGILRKSLPLAASISILLCSTPGNFSPSFSISAYVSFHLIDSYLKFMWDVGFIEKFVSDTNHSENHRDPNIIHLTSALEIS